MTAITRVSAHEAYQGLKNLGSNIKAHSTAISNKSAAGAVGWEEIDKYISFLASAISQINSYLPTTGLNAYVLSIHPELTVYDMVAEYTAVRDQANSVISWVSVELPKDIDGYEKAFTRDVAGQKIYRSFPSAAPAMATLRTTLQSLAAVIE